MDIIKKSQYKKTAIGLLPIDWKVLKAGDIFSNHTNKKHDGNLEVLSATQDRGIIPRNKLDIEIKYDKNSLKNYKKVEPGDFVISLRSFQGGIEYSDYEGIVSPAYTVLKNKIEIDEGFYKYLFKKEDFINRLNSVIYGIRDGKQISYSDFKDLKLQYPPIGEQKRIATILSTWDKAIDLKEKLIEQKKEQKKGLMQKLLTGEVRLPGFNSEWKKVRLGDIGKTFNGLSGKSSDDFGKGKPYIPYKTIFDDCRIDITKFDYVQIRNDENQNRVKYGDIFFTTSSETPDEVGMSSVLLDQVDELYLNSFCFGFRLNDFNVLLPEFAQFLLRSNDFRRKIYSLAQGSTRFNISKNEVMKIEVLLPSTEEQEAIAQILTITIKEIKLLQKQAEFLKEQKKGLMQLLLTGKVRVQV